MNSAGKTRRQFRFTGWHMFAAMVAFFGVIVGVNLTMAMLASKSWTGLVVKSSYVASQKFNSELAQAEQQRSMGWTSDLSYAAGQIRLGLKNRQGEVLFVDEAHAYIGRPAYERDDQAIVLTRAGDGSVQGDINLAPGAWAIRVEAEIKGQSYRRDARMIVSAEGTGFLE